MYGYDSVNFDNDFLSFDENYYLEMSKPKKIESFDNVVNELIQEEDNCTINENLKKKIYGGNKY